MAQGYRRPPGGPGRAGRALRRSRPPRPQRRASIEAEELLVATGRRPRTHDLDLETAGLEHGGGSRSTRPFRAPGEGWLDAIGDVNGSAALTHMGKYQAHVASQAILGRPANTEPAPVTRVVFTEPPGGERRDHARSRARRGRERECVRRTHVWNSGRALSRPRHSWCGPWRQFALVIDQIAAEQAGH